MARHRSVSKIASDLNYLAHHVREYLRTDQLNHLAANVRSAQIRAVRLFIEAVDAGAFPKPRAMENHGWFDRKQAALPGGRIFFTDKLKTGVPMTKAETVKLAMAYSDDRQCHGSYPFLIAWLRNARPNSFRSDATEVHLEAVATDRQGRSLGKDGKPARYILNGRRMPIAYKPNVLRLERGFSLKLDAVSESYFYTDADWLNTLRTQCEVCEDACRALSDLIEPIPDSSLSTISTETLSWLTVTAAAHLLMIDIPGLSLKNARARVSKAANDGTVRSNGKKRSDRRIDPTSLAAWRLQKRDRHMDDADKLTKARRGKCSQEAQTHRIASRGLVII